jgi:cobalt/nickel transport system permease protein
VLVHVPDGFLDAPTSIATGVVAAGAIAVALRGARKELDDRTVPMAGLVAAFVFSTQMLNFPVAGGTCSGGPWPPCWSGRTPRCCA